MRGKETDEVEAPANAEPVSKRCYNAYDLVIESAFELPEMPRIDPGPHSPDVVIQNGDVEPVPESASETGIRRIDAGSDVCRITYESIGSFFITDGDRVIVDIASPDVAQKKVFRRLLQNELMAVLLMQRGLLVLHASAVSVNGKAAVFLGDRGAGKSTTAAAFHAHGHALLEDDTVAVRFDDGTPVVVPGVPHLRLSPDAVTALGFEETTTPAGDWGPVKQYLGTGAIPDPTPLARCYVLQDGDSLEFKEIPPRNRPFVLVTSTYAQGLLPDTGMTEDHFEQCATVVDSASIKRLVRPRDHAQLSLLVSLVADDIG